MMYVGLLDVRKKKRWSWIEAPGGTSHKFEGLGEQGLFSKQLQKGATPGSVYEMSVKRSGDNDLSVTVNGGRYLGRLEDDDLVAELQVKHHAVTLAFDTRGKASRERAERLDLSRLEPFREAYDGLMVQIIHYVTRGRRS